MNHAQALKKLAADRLIQALDEDIARLVGKALMRGRHDSAIAGEPAGYVLPRLLSRWNCVLQAGDEVATALYRQKVVLAMALLLHKHGVSDAALSARAKVAIDALNAAVALSDDFFRQSGAIKALLEIPTQPPKRAPAAPDSLTFYRAQDVVSVQVEGGYFAAYVHECAAVNESPVIEFYDAQFDHVPAIAELASVRARGQRYNDGIERIARFSVSGMKYLPDFAGQLVLIKACVEAPPACAHLSESVGLYSMSDIFALPKVISELFAHS